MVSLENAIKTAELLPEKCTWAHIQTHTHTHMHVHTHTHLIMISGIKKPHETHA